jgi:hypothetical protein
MPSSILFTSGIAKRDSYDKRRTHLQRIHFQVHEQIHHLVLRDPFFTSHQDIILILRRDFAVVIGEYLFDLRSPALQPSV